MFRFKASSLLFGPVSVKVKLMATSMEDTESISRAASTDNDEYSYKYIVQEGVYTVSQRCYFSEVQSKVQSIVQSKVHSPGFTPTLILSQYSD